MSGDRGLLVRRIEAGTVIDHIPAGRALMVLRILGITGREGYTVAVVMNVESKKLGRKDIVKIEGRYMDPQEINKIALVAPQATINRIEDYRVREKLRVTPPDHLHDIIRCTNPTCITRKPREPVTPKFTRVPSGRGISYQCVYCGTIIREKEILEQLASTS